MKNAALSLPAESAEYTSCGICSRINARAPFCGPQSGLSSSGTVTRVWYSHASDLYELLGSALEKGCHLCSLVLDAIRKHYVLISNKKNVLDDWDLVEDIDEIDESGDDRDTDSDADPSLSSRQDKHYDHFFHETETSFDAVNDTQSPLILEFIFREPRRDELTSRCNDVVVHWTQTGGQTRLSTSALTLVAQISGEF